MTKQHVVLGGLLLAAAAQAIYYLPKLPNPMASHFAGNGVPNGWSSPGEFFAIILVVEALCAGAFLFTPMLRGLPDSMINMPNKEYWLAPERREQTMQRLQHRMLTFGIATQLLLLYAVQLTIQANQAEPVRLSTNLGWAIGVYVVGSLVWTFHLLRAYRLPRPGGS